MPEFISSYLGHIPYLISQDTYSFAQYSAKDNQYHDDTCKSNRNSAFLGTSQLLDAVMYLCHREQPQYMSFFFFSSIAGTTEQPCYSRIFPPKGSHPVNPLTLSFLWAHPLVAIFWCHLLSFDVQVTMAGKLRMTMTAHCPPPLDCFEFPGVDQTTTLTTI